MPSDRQTRTAQQYKRRMAARARHQALVAARARHLVQTRKVAIERIDQSEAEIRVTKAALRREEAAYLGRLKLLPIRSARGSQCFVGAATHIPAALECIVRSLQGPVTTLWFMDSCEIQCRGAIPAAYKHCIVPTKPGSLSCVTLAVHVLHHSLSTHEGWFVLGRWLGTETAAGLRPIVSQQLMLSSVLQQLNRCYWVADFKMLLALLNWVPVGHVNACPYCRHVKDTWRTPGVDVEANLRRYGELDNPVLKLQSLTQVVYCPMHMNVQTYCQVLAALYFLAERLDCTTTFLNYMEETKAPFRVPESRKVGQREFSPLWKEIKACCKSMEWWCGLAERFPCISVTYKRQSRGGQSSSVTNNALQEFVRTLGTMFDAMYTHEPKLSPAEYLHKGKYIVELWFVLGLEPTRQTTPVHIFCLHAHQWVHLPTVALATEGGEKAHQTVKNKHGEHWRLKPPHVPRFLSEDMTQCVKKIIAFTNNNSLL